METMFEVLVDTIAKAKKFVSITNEFDCDIDVIRNRYTIDGKSIMGLFSLDLLKPITVKIHSDNEEGIKRFNEVMEEFKYENNL